MRSNKRTMLLPVMALAAACAFGGTRVAVAGVPLSLVDQAAGPHTLAPLLQRISPAVVGIRADASDARNDKTTKDRPAPHGSPTPQGRTASGVVFDAAQGLIVTNNHVVEHGSTLTVQLSDGRELEARLVGADAATDVAVVKVRAEGLIAVELGDSDDLQIGDFVFTLGNAAPLGRTVTAGIIGGLHRSRIGLAQAEDFIQTDAAFYPGDSGSALIDMRGRVVGINAGFMEATTTNSGMGFAIPANLARNVVDQLLERGEIRRGSLGFALARPPASTLRNRSPAAAITPVIESVEAGSAAERAGLKVGDVVTAIGGVPVRDADELQSRLRLEWAGNPIELTVRRTGGLVAIHGVMPEPAEAPSRSPGR